jgi:hypothetical protein
MMQWGFVLEIACLFVSVHFAVGYVPLNSVLVLGDGWIVVNTFPFTNCLFPVHRCLPCSVVSSGHVFILHSASVHTVTRWVYPCLPFLPFDGANVPRGFLPTYRSIAYCGYPLHSTFYLSSVSSSLPSSFFSGVNHEVICFSSCFAV